MPIEPAMISSVPSESNDVTRWIVRQRPERERVEPFKPRGFSLEQERSDSGQIVRSGVIFLTNKECPWRCLMCDLWKDTTTHSVPDGAIPRQIDLALKAWREAGENVQQVKLYNSGSFFDPAAIPPGDYPAIAQRI